MILPHSLLHEKSENHLKTDVMYHKIADCIIMLNWDDFLLNGHT